MDTKFDLQSRSTFYEFYLFVSNTVVSLYFMLMLDYYNVSVAVHRIETFESRFWSAIHNLDIPALDGGTVCTM